MTRYYLPVHNILQGHLLARGVSTRPPSHLVKEYLNDQIWLGEKYAGRVASNLSVGACSICEWFGFAQTA